MKLDEAAGILDKISDYARRPDATRRKLVVLEREDWTTHDDVWGATTGPDLDVYVGPGVGFLVWVGKDRSFITADGLNDDPVEYAVDEWVGRTYPSRVELPIDLVRGAIQEFISTGNVPTSVQWAPYGVDVE